MVTMICFPWRRAAERWRAVRGVARPMPLDADSARVENRQLPIFARDSRAVCAELELSWRDAQKLHEDGFLSFDPAAGGVLDESREAELVFLGAIAAAGCSRRVLRQLLAGLRKPYCYDMRRLFFEWRSHRWRLLPGEDDPEGAFFSLLDRLRERREYEALLNIRAWLEEALDLAQDRAHLFTHLNPGGLLREREGEGGSSHA